MKVQSQCKRFISLVLSMIMLTNCTVYNAVQKPPADLEDGYKTTLHKDGLVFHLINTTVRDEALYGELAYPNTQHAKKSSMNIYLKPGVEIIQDSLGILEVPFESIAYIEYYEKDPRKSRNHTIMAVIGTILGGTILFIILVSMAMSDLDTSFKVEQI